MNRFGSPARAVTVIAFLALLLAAALMPPLARASDPVLPFLKIGIGARAAAMGDAVVSHVDDATAVYWNPGAIAFLPGTQIDLTHNSSLQGVRDEFGSITRNFGRHSLGFSFDGLWTDPLKGYDDTGARQLDFTYSDMAATGNFSYLLRNNLGVGFGVEYLREIIDIQTFSGYGVNLGIQAREVLPGTSVGLSVLHLGSSMTFEKESFPLPTEIQGGITHVIPFAGLSGRVLMSVELRKVRQEGTQFLFGTEYEYKTAARLEVGYHGGLDEQNVAFGLGVGGGKVRGEYSVVPFGADLGTSQRISLLLKF